MLNKKLKLLQEFYLILLNFGHLLSANDDGNPFESRFSLSYVLFLGKSRYQQHHFLEITGIAWL